MIQKTIRRFGLVMSLATLGLLLTSATTSRAVARTHRHGRHGVHARATRVHGKIRHNASRAYAARHHHGKHFARLSRHHEPQRALTSEEKNAIVQEIRELAESTPESNGLVATNITPNNVSNLGDSIVAAEKNSESIQAQIAEAAKEEQAEDGTDASLDQYFKSRPGATNTQSIDPAAMNAALNPAVEAEQQPDILLSDQTDPSHTAQRSDVMAEIINWIGTRYQFGGVDRGGIDCSAFTREVFEKSFGLELPRTAYEQFQIGEPVEKPNLEFGDLVFFHTAGYAPITHVGIYIGEGLFANAACSRGVTVASLESEYWQKHYVGARRLFNNSGLASVKTDQTIGAMADGSY